MIAAADIRDVLETDLQHQRLGYALLGVTTGLGVWGAGETLLSAGMPESVAVTGAIAAAGVVPTATWYALVKLGL
ncbi:hypothetical protein [Halobacterium jilantaiense]|uniref:Uncharacterized protein n=1 Tax=Halobacterium jilantaiense TaxID=355548 RepID=A0A1I0MT58_9EURY|nr:hypothetical protein [Halobacterium jilantaiense]SEV91387.1 hypothetical protein SAMN04487945_0321 [Halobacterium jilantaiense]